MKKCGLLVAAFAVVMVANGTCEAARWKIRSPQSGQTFAITANIAASGSAQAAQIADVQASSVVNGAYLFDGGGVFDVAASKKGKWATVVPAPFVLTTAAVRAIDPNGSTALTLTGRIRFGGRERDYVLLNIVP